MHSPLPRPQRRKWTPLRYHLARLRREALARMRKAQKKGAR